MFVGYVKQETLTRENFDGEWFDTGDLATLDAEGFIRITGRLKDIIIRGGENIPVKYVEDILYEDPRVQDAAIVAMPDPRAVAADAPGMTPLDFDGIDAAIVCGSAVKAAASDELLRGVLTALDGWVRRGGRLVFIAGTSAAELAAGKSSAEASPPARASPAAAWLPGPKGRPGRVERLVPLRRSAAIETYGRADRPLETAAVPAPSTA